MEGVRECPCGAEPVYSMASAKQHLFTCEECGLVLERETLKSLLFVWKNRNGEVFGKKIGSKLMKKRNVRK